MKLCLMHPNEYKKHSAPVIEHIAKSVNGWERWDRQITVYIWTSISKYKRYTQL